MEIDCDNVAEIEKYAFLLGSAIKNEDTEQFFSIYDSILPKDLPDKQLEEIKDKARAIADLPEGRFNDLVFRARTFSLAPAGPTMSYHGSHSKKWSPPAADDSEDEGVGSAVYTGSKSDTSSLYSINTTKIVRSLESDPRRFDDDSGVCNSSKATNSIDSLSDDHDGSDYESRRHFDYFPPQVKIRSGCGLNLDYDEAHEVKSNHSSQDVNSPRSDFSDGIEMVTMSSSRRRVDDDDDDDFSFNRTSNDQDDFNTEEDSDEDQNSYRHKYYKQGYRPLPKESDYSLKFDSSRAEWGSMSTSSLRTSDVDRGINFSSLKEGQSPYSRYSSYASHFGSSASSEKVKIEKKTYKKDPPFGKGAEQLDKVANSLDTLISSSIPAHEVKNMPEGRKLEVLTPEDPKKKKKKKRVSKASRQSAVLKSKLQAQLGIKDDVATTDENGNPIELGLKPSCYRQMREPPSNVAGPTSNNRQHYDSSYGTFSSLDLHSSFPNHRDSIEDASSKSDQKTKRKKNKKDKEEVIRAEDIKNYVGDKPIDELIDFIGGQHVSNKKAKKLPTPITEDIPVKAQKGNKKNKDKKQKSPTPNSIEEVDSRGDFSAQTANLNKQVGLNNMGNSSGKTDAEIVENGDTDGLYSRKEKLTKALLKENDRKLEIPVINHINLKEHVNCKELMEKESTKTIDKKDTGRETIVENKKKVDKSVKTVKVEKLEMSSSKSEDTMKYETTVGNSVTIKQKNAKNKKSKPQSPTIKVEHELSSPELQINHHPLSGVSDDMVDNNFIFTDLDVPSVPKEDEFQVVGKKKKKAVKDTIQHNNYISNSWNSNKPTRRHEDKRSVNSNLTSKIPAPSTIQTSFIDSDTRARDLSPSAFPALGNSKGRQSLQDGRRNSTGDVPILSETLKVQDDSDIESVKSLPATQGCYVADTVLSPRLISYAKMAASAKQIGSMSPGDDQCSLDGGESEGHDHKNAVWKGSPTERRHSIGSSPEGVNIGSKTAGSPNHSAATSLKAGSQENIKGEITSKLDSNVNVKTSKVFGMVNVGDTININEDIVQGTSGLSSESSRNAKVCLATTPVQSVKASSSVSLQTKCQDGAHTSSSSNTRQLMAEMPIKTICAEIEPKVNSSSSVNGKSSNSKSNILCPNVHKQEIQKPKPITTNNNKKQKSVIFLDKRVGETPENLGISFGFEIEPLVDKVSKPQDTYKNTNLDQSEPIAEIPTFGNIDTKEISSSAPIYSENDSNVSFLSEPVGSPVSNVDIRPSKKSSNTSVISNDSNTEAEPSSSSPDNTVSNPFTKKVSSELGRLNGVVVSQAQGQTKNNVKVSNEVSEDKQSEIKSLTSTPPNHGAHFVSPIVQVNNQVIVYYGESVATLKKDVIASSPTNGPTRFCGLLGFVQESEVRSNFNVAEVAAILTREWDETVQLQDREPERVKVHLD